MPIGEVAIKYLPSNTSPDNFMRPTTEGFQNRLITLCFDLEGRINVLAQGFVPASAQTAPRLRIGSEVEFNLFSDKFDPRVHHIYATPNPNYSKEHKEAVQTFAQRMQLLAREGGIRGALQRKEAVTVDTLFMEARTKPADVEGYIEENLRLQRFVQQEAARLHINPVMISNHLHLSLTNAQGERNLLQEDRNHVAIIDAVQRGILDMYHRGVPLIRLPEEVETDIYNNIGIKQIHWNGEFGSRTNPERLEARVNSSEYMFDPWVNLFVHLLGVYRGLQHIGDIQALDKDYKIRGNDDGYQKGSYFTLGPDGRIKTYDQALHHLLRDRVFSQWFSPGERQELVDALADNWDISAGRRSVAEVRDAKKAAQGTGGKGRRGNGWVETFREVIDLLPIPLR